jgi:hypothetical protein
MELRLRQGADEAAAWRAATSRPFDQLTPRRPTMLLAMSLLSSIAQSRLVRWMRTAHALPRGARY